MKRTTALFTKCNFKMVLVITLLSLLSFTSVNAQNTYPKPTDLKYINDYTSSIDDSTKEYIVSVGRELEDKTGAQSVVVVVDSLNGSDIATYSNELFRTWGIGQKDKNNGLLILIAIKDRKWKVEVGTSLEGAIPDIYSARVMDSLASPKFKAGNYSEGVKDSYSSFADAIAKEYNVTLDKNQQVNLPTDTTTTTSTGTNALGMVVGIILIIFIILDFIFNRGRITFFLITIAFLSGRGGGRGGGNSGGGGLGGMGGGSSSGGGSSGSF